MTSTARELMFKRIESFNSDDIDALRGLYADDAQEKDITTGEVSDGADAAVEGLLSFKRAFPDLKATVTALHGDEKIVTVETNYAGTHTEPLEWDEQVYAPTGRRLSLDIIEVVEIKDGKIGSSRIYYDSGAVLAQIRD
jgi:steroid delta-isomerase-like uncharacterized protein